MPHLWLAPLLLISLTCFGTVTAAPPARAPAPSGSIPAPLTLELHAHLFMKEGMTWAFDGDFFDERLHARDWKARFSSEANPASLERSEAGIVVATLYAHPFFTTSLRNSVRRQLELANRFVTEHPDWIIARSPDQAREALRDGRRVLVLALEGADGIIENEADLAEFVDRGGIRIVTLLHLTDDQYGGVAYLRGVRALANPWTWLKQVIGSSHDPAGVKINSRGVTAAGLAMARALRKHHVWVDLAHASDAAELELAAEFKGLPLLHTHTSLRKYLGAERGISEAQLKRVAESGGLIGLMPSEEYLVGTPSTTRGCEGGARALARQYAEAAAVLGADGVAMGSDYNGGVPHLHPEAGPCQVGAGLDTEGLWNIGQVPALWTTLERLGAPVPAPRARMIERFLSAWAKW